MLRSIRFAAMLAALSTIAYGQKVSVKDGNVFLRATDGSTIQVTSSGLDSDPSLSLDKKLIVFVRRTPSLTIETGLGRPADNNELWIAETTRMEPPHRVLVGHAGGFKLDDNLVLAGFGSPQFSPDASRIYFGAQTWATQYSFRMLDLRSGRVHFLYAGLGLEVLETGKYAGYLIALKTIPSMITARISGTGCWIPTERTLARLAGMNRMLRRSRCSSENAT